MRLIKTKPKYQCAYCRHQGMKKPMEKHEKICWRNPQRHCELCNDRHFIYEEYGDGLGQDLPCPYCSQYDATKVPPTNEVATEHLISSKLGQS